MAKQSAAEGKPSALNQVLADITKKFGNGSIMRLGENTKMAVEVIPTGIMSLDLAIGVGGLPRGRIVEIFGPESSGKTTVALHVIAEAQKNGGVAAFIDAEHALDPQYEKKLGVNIEEMFVSQPDCGEHALEICEMLISSGAIDVVVIDSVAALVPKAEIEGEMGDMHVGLQARLMSQAMRKLTSVAAKSKAAIIFINQLREKVGGGFGGFAAGIQETTTGGRALKFYATVRLDVRRIEAIKDKSENIGMKTSIKVVKNKVAPPFKQSSVEMYYGEGVSREMDALDNAEKYGIVEKSGAWYSYKGDQIGQGRENVRQFLKSHPEIVIELNEKIKGVLESGGQEAKAVGDNVVAFARGPEQETGS